MQPQGFDRDEADGLLDATPTHEELPAASRPLADLLGRLRLMSQSPPDPAQESVTVKAMAEAIRKSRRGSWLLRRDARLAPVGVRAAVVVGAVVLAGTAGAALAGPPQTVTSVADAVLAGVGLEPEDEADRQADLRDREEDEAERLAEASEPLPDVAAEGRATAAERQGAAARYTEAVRAWTACVKEATAKHEDSGATEPFDPVAACNAHPRPQDFGLAKDEAEEDEADNGRPEGAGRPAHAGPPANAGPPEGAGPPANAGPPVDAGPPATAGPPPGSRAPRGAGPPPGAGPPQGAGPPPGAGPPQGAGPPTGAGPPQVIGPGSESEPEEEEEEEEQEEAEEEG
jgi:hypothetical protein